MLLQHYARVNGPGTGVTERCVPPGRLERRGPLPPHIGERGGWGGNAVLPRTVNLVLYKVEREKERERERKKEGGDSGISP